MQTTKVLVLYYSSYGHIETMAQAVAAGARGGRYRGHHQARGDGKRMPSANELGIARFQGKHVAQITRKLLIGSQG